ncbi:hypothetical protein [Arthrobacter sp.]|uniref:hypothetical protein n=1 Tax=Arthrobacter sp. TaxID=1667 RepID=UPI00281284B4|nr:hypothetical protein [Arthrobacter sp.]
MTTVTPTVMGGINLHLPYPEAVTVELPWLKPALAKQCGSKNWTIAWSVFCTTCWSGTFTAAFATPAVIKLDPTTNINNTSLVKCFNRTPMFM